MESAITQSKRTVIGTIIVKLREQCDIDDEAIELTTQGISRLDRFERLGELSDLEDGILKFLDATALTDDGHPNKPARLCNLGNSQLTRFQRLGELADINNAIINQQKAVDLTHGGRSPKPRYLSSLGSSQLRRFERQGELADLESSVWNQRMAVSLTDDAHPDKPGYLSNLGVCLGTRFEHIGQLADLENAISNKQKAVELTGDGHCGKPAYLSNLGNSQLSCFQRLGELADLESAILNHQKAVELTDDGQPSKPVYLSNLGNCLSLRFNHLGILADLERGISIQQKVVELTDDRDPSQPGHLSNLGSSQEIRFGHLGLLVDLDNAISNLLAAVGLTDGRSPHKAGYLLNLGISQRCRFEHQGELADLDNAISNQQKAVELMGDGCPDAPMYLSNLGASMSRRFDRLGIFADLEMAISHQQKSVELTNDGDPSKPGRLSNLGSSQQHRFERLGELVDIENAIANADKAVQLMDDGQPAKPGCLSKLGTSQRSRFEHLGEIADVDSAIANQQMAVDLTDDGHPDKPMYFSTLGNSLSCRFDHFGILTDLESAISNQQKAVDMTDDGHPGQAKNLHNLGSSQFSRFERFGEEANLVASLSAFKAAARSKTGYPECALSAARLWALISHEHGDFLSALDGYRTALEILPKVVWLGLDAASHHDWLVRERSENLGCLAAACAIRLGRLEEAVELLDLGRSVFWQQASSLRGNRKSLREEEPELANELERVGRRLDAGNFSGPSSTVGEGNVGVHTGEVTGKERRRLVAEWEGLVERVRQLPKFKYFLKPLPFRQLRQAATAGRIIIINICESGVDALIFGATGPIEHVPLPMIKLEKLTALTHNLMQNRSANDSRGTQRRNLITNNLRKTLHMIWHVMLVPIFDKIQIPLESNTGLSQPRIWWYPTGPLTFIPIHAAGPASDTVDISRMMISSYVTTLDSLFQAQSTNKQAASTGRSKLLALSQPKTPGHCPLPQSTPEVLRVVEAAQSAGWVREDIVHLDGSDATVDRVLDALDSCSWAHFACHGSQDPILGTKSAFALEDGCLELGQIASKQLSGQFAFLSACCAASGLKALPGEAMHLAAGLQFTGFPSIIATMWGILDEDAPKVADHVYRYLLRNGVDGLHPSDAAAALNHAVLCLRKDPEVTVDRWAPFIHFGI